MKLYLNGNNKAQFQLTGDFIYIKNSPVPLLIETDLGGRYELSQNEQIICDKLNCRVTVQALTDFSGNVEILSGFGQFVPSIDINSMPSVNVAVMPEIDVSSMPEIDISSMPEIDISSMPEIDVSSMPAIDINTIPEIDVKAGSRISTSVLIIKNKIATLLANKKRKHLYINVPSKNKNPVLIDTFELMAGDKINFSVVGEIIFNGVDSDSIQILEVF